MMMKDAVLTADTSADPNTATLILEDLSGSMRGLTPSGKPKIQESEEVTTQIVQGIVKDAALSASIDLMLIGFPGMKEETEVLRPFGPVDANTQVTLDVSPQYGTPIAAAVALALDSIEERRRHYRTKNISAKRPHVFLKTDGGATDSPEALEAVGKRVRALKDAGKLEMFILFIADSIADEQREALEQLEAVFGVKPHVFAPGQIKNMFTLVSVSLKAPGKPRAAAFTPATGLSDRQAGD